MSELALRLIEENKKTRATFLDLGNCGLTEVPAEIGELVWLEGLSFGKEWWDENGDHKTQNSGPANSIRRLAPSASRFNAIKQLFTAAAKNNPFSRLLNLKRLWLNGYDDKKSDLTDLSPLAGLSGLQTLNVWNTQVADLSPLSGLSGLQTLNVSGTQVADLSPLSGLAGLQSLVVSNSQVTDLSPLSGLSGLQELNVSNSQVADLSPLSGLSGLQTLVVSETQVADLSPLSGLAGLQTLDVSGTQVADLSPVLPLIRQGVLVQWSYRFWQGPGIYVQDCPLTNPPAEVVKQGNEAILNYFKEKETQGIDHLYEAKLLIVGEGGSGKTSLLRRLYQTDKPLPEEAETTKGIDIYRHEFKLSNGRDFRLNVWDFGGQEIYHATHQFFLTKRSLYVLLDDTRKDYKTVQDEGFKYWLDVVDQLSDHSPVLIFQNEKGGRSKTIDQDGIKGHFSNVIGVFKGNLELSNAANKLRDALEFFASQLPHIGEELPARWVAIRADLETQAEKKSYISQQEYFDLYTQHLEFNRDKALLLSRYFHDLGVFLHFQDDLLLQKTVILQNTWATEAVFKMLDDEIVKKSLGRFTLGDCQRVWQDSAYADMHMELLALMQKFELCYPLPDTRPDTWLAPQLLPPSKPLALANWEQPGDLVLRFRYDFMPKGLISRLMVRQHRFVPQPDLGWVTGVLFERDGSQVLAEIPPKGGEIALRARGPERKELLSVIAADLNALNASFHGLKEKVEKLVPCNCKQCQGLAQPRAFELRELLRRKEHGKLKVECPGSFDYVDVLELLDGIRAKVLPSWAKLKIFISYSHAQRAYFPIFKADFNQYATFPDLDIEVFGDDAIPLGAAWDEYLQGKVADCHVMVLLVSQEFMNSRYIREKEFGAAVERLNAGRGLLIVPVYFAPCQFDSDAELSRLQFFKPHGRDFDEAQKGDRFSYIDLVKFNQKDGESIPNANRQHYMMELMKKLQPELRKLANKG